MVLSHDRFHHAASPGDFIPLYILFHKLGWLNTFLPLIVPSWFGGGALNIFLMRQFFLGIPHELDEAVLMDGAGHFTIWWKIYVPLSRPVMVTVALLTTLGIWNDFLGPLIYLTTPEKYTLALGLSIFQGQFVTPSPLSLSVTPALDLVVLKAMANGQPTGFESAIEFADALTAAASGLPLNPHLNAEPEADDATSWPRPGPPKARAIGRDGRDDGDDTVAGDRDDPAMAVPAPVPHDATMIARRAAPKRGNTIPMVAGHWRGCSLSVAARPMC